MANKTVKILRNYSIQGIGVTVPQVFPIFSHTITYIALCVSIAVFIGTTIHYIWDSNFFSWGRKIPLKTAAIISYEKTKIADRFYSSPEDKLGYHAQQILEQIPLYGEKPPSKISVLIPLREIQSFKFNDELDAFYYLEHGKKEPQYINLMVKLSDLNQMIKTSARLNPKTKKIIYPGLD